MFGDARLQRFGDDRLEEALLLGAPQPPRIDRDQQVGRALRAFAFDARDQFVAVTLDQVDRNAGPR